MQVQRHSVLPHSPVPFPLGLHVLPLGATQLGLLTSGTDESIQEEGSAAYTHTRLINGCNATLIKWPTMGITLGLAYEAGLSQRCRVRGGMHS